MSSFKDNLVSWLRSKGAPHRLINDAKDLTVQESTILRSEDSEPESIEERFKKIEAMLEILLKDKKTMDDVAEEERKRLEEEGKIQPHNLGAIIQKGVEESKKKTNDGFRQGAIPTYVFSRKIREFWKARRA